jgi:hypothetical protein
MTLGLSLPVFTLVHVILSLVGIAAGLAALIGLIRNRFFWRTNALFLLTTALTSFTGFMFPFKGITPGIILGVLSMIALMVAFLSLYLWNLAGAWRGTYVISACLALYFNVFVLFAQLFAKVPALKAIAPTQASPAFGITQAVLLVFFVLYTRRAFKAFRPA